MFISAFRLGNYKSFYAPPPLELELGFNIIVGQNSAGKTALLEALSLNFSSDPHRSLKTVPLVGVQPDATSWADVSFSLSREELLDIMLTSGQLDWHLPRPVIGSDFAKKLGYGDHSPASSEKLVSAVMSQDNLTFKLRLEKAPVGESWKCSEFPSFGLYSAEDRIPPQPRNLLIFRVRQDRTAYHHGGTTRADETQEMGPILGPHFRSRIYRFWAERFNVGECPFGHNRNLAPDAANLPEVLNNLQANPSRFRALNQLLHRILPQIRQVSVCPIPNNRVRIIVWGIDPETQRQDLAVPLNKSGSGVGQVLAMLYVVSTSDYPQTILIDEPQSFLHPGGVHKLIEVLKDYPQHQFIIATHSPTVITAASPETITLTKLQDGESVTEQIDSAENKDLQACLAELGARLSDVFGADRILWAEGPTEENCFPLIIRKLGNSPLMGTAIVGIRRTGELEGRDAQRIFEIYSSLSRGATLLPPTVGFLFDRECRSDAQQEEIRRRSQEPVIFLPRRMYENYLLNPTAICSVINDIDGFRATPVTEDEIRAVIEDKRSNRTYFCRRGADGNSPEWTFRIDAARVLKDIFSELSETRVTYRKVKHSVALTEWLIDHAPEELSEARDILIGLLGGQQKS